MTTQADFAWLLEKQSEMNLKYRTKIIQLENELNHQKIRAKQYQNRYQDAMLQSEYSEGQNLLEKLNHKENQLFDCQNQIIELNRKLTNIDNMPSQSDLIALARQNQQLMQNIEQIKNAAISAIVMKEEQIEDLKKTAQRSELMQNQLKYQYEKYQSIQRQVEIALKEKDEQIKQLNQKISRQREHFFSKLQTIQKEAHQQQNYKQKLLEKTYDLQGNLEKSENIINEYQNKIYELEHQISQQKILTEQEKTKLQFQIEDLQQSMKAFEKQEKVLNKYIQEYKGRQKNMQENLARLNDINEDLKHKLSIKKKKENKLVKDKITSSFSGLQKHNPVYTSFAFRPHDSVIQQSARHLGEIPEMDDFGGLIENFSVQDIEPEQATVKQPLPMSKMMSKNKQKPAIKKQSAIDPNIQKVQIKNDYLEQVNKQIQNQKLVSLRLQTQKKQLQNNLNGVYNQMQQLNKSLNNVTLELQQERKNISELRQQLKKTKKEAQLIVEMQSLNLHVQKLQNDMIATKLKYAEQIDHQKQKHQREKVSWTDKLVKLTERIAKQDLQIPQKQVKTEQKKKKKGFFG